MMLEHSDLYPVFPEYLVCPEGVQCTGKADSSSAQSSKVSGTVELSGTVCDQPGRIAAGAAPAATPAAAAAAYAAAGGSADADADSADSCDEQDDEVLDDAELEEAHDEDTGEAADSPAGGSAPAAGTAAASGTGAGGGAQQKRQLQLSTLIRPRSFASLQLRARNAMKGLFALNRERMLVLCASSSVDPFAVTSDMVRELTGIEPTVAYAPTKFELFGDDSVDGILTAGGAADSATAATRSERGEQRSGPGDRRSDSRSEHRSLRELLGKLAAPQAGQISSEGEPAGKDAPGTRLNVVIMPCIHLIDHPKWLGMVEACLAQNSALKLILVGNATDVAQLSMLWPVLDNAIHADIVLEFSVIGALQTLAGLISWYQTHDSDGRLLLPFDRDALAVLAAYSCRLSGDRRYIGLPEVPLKGLIYEASRYAWQDWQQRFNRAVVNADLDMQAQMAVQAHASALGLADEATASGDDASVLPESLRNPHVGRRHMLKALGANDFRNNFLAESSLREHRDRQLLVATQGAVVGQINGLSVIETLGTNYEYGEPVRITATLRAGGEGDVIDIERKAELAGQIHAKAMMIINGFLTKEFGAEQPLPVSASLVFEQSYSEVDGDSASLTGLCAVISVLAGVPVRQDLAVTGAVDQFGDVQAVGGVNEKIEGFYRVCRLHGFTGTQGVIIPSSCVNQLVLRPSVIKAVRDGKFHIFTVSHVTEAVKMLTTVDWGDSETENTICYRICERLNNIIAGAQEESWTERLKNRFEELLEKVPLPFLKSDNDDSEDEQKESSASSAKNSAGARSSKQA